MSLIARIFFVEIKMIPNQFFLCIIAVLLQACLFPAFADSPEQSKVAAWHLEGCRTAAAYIAQLDQGNYQEGWLLCDPIFQRALNQDEWKSDLKSMKEDHGGITSRTLKGQHIAWDPQDLPAGLYIVIEYDSTSQHYPSLKEVLTLKIGEDNQWRVLVYQLHKPQ